MVLLYDMGLDSPSMEFVKAVTGDQGTKAQLSSDEAAAKDEGSRIAQAARTGKPQSANNLSLPDVVKATH